MTKILLLEDSEDSQLLVKQALKTIDAELRVVQTLKEAYETIPPAADPGFALFILDLHLPDGCSIEFLETIQRHPVARHQPVILLTAETDLDTKVRAFQRGADDYLLKPVNPLELRARIEAKLRKHARASTALQRGALSLDPATLQAMNLIDGRSQKLDLTAKEFKILYLLMQNEDQALRRAEIVKAAWGEGMHLAARTVDSHICALRKKLGAAAGFIQSVPGMGYRFSSEPARAEASAAGQRA